MAFLVKIVALYIFQVGLVVFLRIPSITGFLGEGFSLLLYIYLNVWLGVLGQNMQIFLPSLRVYFIPSSVVIVYVTLQFDILPPTMLH